ncbi:MAG TPA: hypothetical protein VF944_09355 [Candidatus Bathyarchaeia archaeon]
MSEAARELTEVQRNPDLDAFEQNRVARRARITRPKWNPKQWHPIYEEVVLLDAMGLSRKDIALEKGFTETHVTNIMNTEQAKIIKQLLIARLRKKHEETIDQRLEKMALKAMDRVEEVMQNDELAEKNPLGLFDRAIVLLKGTKKIATEETTNIKNAMIVSEQGLDRLLKGMEKADEARRLHGLQPILIDNAKPSNP